MNYSKLKQGMAFPEVEAILGAGKEVSRSRDATAFLHRWNWTSPAGCSITIVFATTEPSTPRFHYVRSMSIIGD